MPVPSPSNRAEWLRWAERVATPVLTSLARGTLHADMPIEAHNPAGRRDFARLEAVARLLCGIAPWLELAPASDETENRLRARLLDLARRGLAHAADPASPEAFNFTRGAQPLVDAAFLAQAFLRAPSALWAPLDETTRHRLLAGLRATRAIQPYESNWLLFAAIIEAFLHTLGDPIDEARLANALEKHEAWYKGDGAYGDGAEFHWDYYNAFVIQPMLIDVLAIFGAEERWRDFAARVEKRAARFAAVQERFIAPDGSYPPIGRSLAYRAGAFQSLAQAALRHRLPAEVPPARARRALTLAQRRTLDAPGTFDAAGWLHVGLAGHQPSLAESYICTGSCYLCSFALLPLGLPVEDPFWSDPEIATTNELAWGGIDLPADTALKA